MKDQINTIRSELTSLHGIVGDLSEALAALSELESSLAQYEAGDVASAAAQGFRDGVASVTQQEPVAWVECDGELVWNNREAAIGRNLYTAAPVAPQHETVTNDEQARAYMDARLWEFIDMAGMWPKAKPDPRIWAHVMVYAPVAQQPQEIEVQCPVCNHKFYEWPNDKQPQAEAVQACGHSMSLLLRSAESNEPLYCEACDDKSGRHDAERRETELMDANRHLQEKIASADALKLHAIEELCQLGYTVKDGKLIPPDHLHKLVEAAGHPLAAPQQAEAVPPTHVLVPVAVLKAASESLGNFVSDHGWTDADMQAMDNLDAIIAQRKGQP